METLQELRKKYNNLNEERSILYKKIAELERKEVAHKFTVGECYLDTDCDNFKKIIAIDEEDTLYCMVINNERIQRDFYYLENTKYWKKITSEQFKDIYLAVLKDIQDPDLDDNKKSNWDVTSEAIMKSLDK